LRDKVPDFELKNILNYTKPVLHLSEFRDKVVVIDLLATGAVRAWVLISTMNRLQARYANDLVFIMVSYDEPERLSILKNAPTEYKAKLINAVEKDQKM